MERVEVKDVRVPEQLQRAMAAEAEAAREARAKVIAAEGEHKASRALKHAADIITESPGALQLRYLQTLSHIADESNSTIIFPVPVDIISYFISNNPLPFMVKNTKYSFKIYSFYQEKSTSGSSQWDVKRLTKSKIITIRFKN